MAVHPTPQTPDEMARDTVGVVWRVCQDMERCAENMDLNGLKINFDFLKHQMTRLELFEREMRKHRQKI